jgi:hypothetical protein
MAAPMARKLSVGEIYRYPYLWRHEGVKGETEGRKERPVCLMFQWQLADEILLLLLPVTGTPPRNDQEFIEVPVIELKRAGLETAKPGWIIISEGNIDVLSGSFYFDGSQKPIGKFGRTFMVGVLKKVHPFLKNRNMFTDRR